MDGSQATWRNALGAYLVTCVTMGGNPTVGELVVRFADTIPLHHASRKWALGRCHDAPLAYPSAYKMRFYTLTQELHWLRCTFSDRRKGWDTIVLVHPRACPVCGTLFVRQPQVQTCGRDCGRELRHRRRMMVESVQ